MVLRKLFEQSGSLAEWSQIKMGFSSRLLRLECLRTIDRLRHRNLLSTKEASNRYAWLQGLLDNVGLLPVTEEILKRSEESFLMPVGALDGIHLATALLWQEQEGKNFSFATHDSELAEAARAHGFYVIG